MNCRDQSVKAVGGTEASKVMSPKELCPKKSVLKGNATRCSFGAPSQERSIIPKPLRRQAYKEQQCEKYER